MIIDMFRVLIDRRSFFMELLLQHITISIISIIIASVIGVLLGIFISEYNKSSKSVLSFVSFIYTIPSISLLGFLIPFSGIGDTTAIIALTVYALLPMVRNTHTGITNIDKNVLEAAKGMGSTNFQILYKIKLPLAFPVIISGLRNMVTMTIALAGIASFIGAGGLGVAIYRGITTNNPAMTMIGSLLIAILAIVMDSIIGALEKLTKRNSKKRCKKTIVLIFSIIFISVILIVGAINKISSNNTINIATKPMTEQYILGEILKELIEKNTDLKVKLTQGVGGGTSNIVPAIEKGDFDIYPEYTGTGWNVVLKQNGLYDESMFETLQNKYERDLNMTWLGMYGFNNTYGLAVRKEIAEKYNLKKYSDLAKISDKLTFGSEYDFFEREDGYDALSYAYGLNFNKTVDLDIGLKYRAINEGKIDVMTVFTTDGQISVSDVVVLEDDKHFYPSYMCGNVIRIEVLKEHPELKKVIEKLNGILNDNSMAYMNYQVETEKKEPANVAHDFLKKSGLIGERE